MKDKMLFASALTTEKDFKDAINNLTTQINYQMGDRSIDLAVIYISPHFKTNATEIGKSLRTSLKARIFIGCSADGVIETNEEIEDAQAISLFTASMPGVELKPFSLNHSDWGKTLENKDSFNKTIPYSEDTKLFMLLADPFTAPMDDVLRSFNQFHPGIPIIGGIVSGSRGPGQSILFFNDQVFNTGAVGITFSGTFEADIIVSQGCRPIGDPFIVTEAKDNVVVSLDGMPPLACLQNLFPQLPLEEQELLQKGLFLGIAVDPEKELFGRGDFLIRGVISIDDQTGAMTIGDYINKNDIVQFHVRDARTAKEDLELLLTPQKFVAPPQGALLFSCNGRGTHLYDHPNGDISTIQKALGKVNLSGFFCAGEIGPIGGKNFLHGFTASMVLFRSNIK